jgi:hypothetical protein
VGKEGGGPIYSQAAEQTRLRSSRPPAEARSNSPLAGNGGSGQLQTRYKVIGMPIGTHPHAIASRVLPSSIALLQWPDPKNNRGDVRVLDQTVQRFQGQNSVRPAVFLHCPRRMDRICLSGRDGPLHCAARNRQHDLYVFSLLPAVGPKNGPASLFDAGPSGLMDRFNNA